MIDYLLVDSLEELPDFMASGLMGLGKNMDDYPTLIDLLFKAGVIQAP